jgi:HEAT repeat protein
VELLHDKDPYIRAAAAEALGMMGDTSALPALQELQQTDYARGRQKRLLLLVADEAIARIQARAQE